MTGNILLIDDTPQNLELLSEMLLNQGYKVRCAISGPVALNAIESVLPDLILLDINMPHMDGYEVCRKLKEREASKEIPIIFVSALSETLEKVKAFEAGGIDYITKPFQLDEVLARISTHMTLKQTQAELNKLNERLEQRVTERTRQLQDEMAERQRVQDQLLYWATHDELTDFFNLPGFINTLEQKMARMQPDADTYAVVTLVFEDLQRVTNALGHLSGEQLLLTIAHRLETALPQDSIIARASSNKFVILLEGVSVEHSVGQRVVLEVIDHVQSTLAPAFTLEQQQVTLRTKWGIALGSPSYSKATHVVQDADIACSQASTQGRPILKESGYTASTYCVFDAQMHERALQWIQLESNLRQAIEHQEFIINYQPIISLDTGQIGGMEALVRWRHPTQGVISPGVFIPIAESSGLIVPLGRIVLDKACRQFQQWQEHYPALTNLKVSVNLSAIQFAQSDLVENVQTILGETNLKPENLKLEITESAIMGNAKSAAALLAELRSQGIQLAIDDFGTGYSSLSYLTQFPVDTLKIDRAFVNKLDHDSKHVGILQAIATLAHTLDMDIVAEGIETEKQLHQVKTFGCEYGQGYLFAKPLDASSMDALLAQQSTWQTNDLRRRATMQSVG